MLNCAVKGHLGVAMELSQELMKQGSYQVDMSDEGMMCSSRSAMTCVFSLLVWSSGVSHFVWEPASDRSVPIRRPRQVSAL